MNVINITIMLAIFFIGIATKKRTIEILFGLA